MLRYANAEITILVQFISRLSSLLAVPFPSLNAVGIALIAGKLPRPAQFIKHKVDSLSSACHNIPVVPQAQINGMLEIVVLRERKSKDFG